MKATGILLRIGATFFFTLMVVFVKMLAGAVPLGQIVFFRSAVALIPLVLFLMWTRDFPGGLKTKRPMAHVLRCLLGCIALYASFASLAYLPLAHATIIGFLAPILAVVLALFVLGEEVTRMRWFAVAFGFLGVLVLVVPKLTAVTLNQAYLIGMIFVLTSALFTAGSKIQIRSLAQTENAGAIAFYFAMTCTVAGFCSVFWGWVRPDPEQLMWLCGAGLAGGVAHIMMTLALQYDEISKLAPFEYLSLIFAVIADVFLFGLIPGFGFYISTAMILIAMWLITFKDRR
ncbi:DMT family transporter [Parasulfitobacter algicola]|uniref:DMT family transporter n=1 Tax=Parasulfitobacter algicola TaxID=2614809 RepID=A0ABX2IW92_9RHOB|nr:DMT family transporter [Sulfitobacter algicola]NSX56820.1 DMT family transporter [Sulfitobacter algicola]